MTSIVNSLPVIIMNIIDIVMGNGIYNQGDMLIIGSSAINGVLIMGLCFFVEG